MKNMKSTTGTMEEEVSKVQKYWKKNFLWTMLLLGAIFVWCFITGPGLSVATGAETLTLTGHDGWTVSVSYDSIEEAELLEEPWYGTMVDGTDQKNGRSGIWEHPQWGSYTLCTYGSCTSAVRLQTREGCFLVNLASREETLQLYQLIQDKMPVSR